MTCVWNTRHILHNINNNQWITLSIAKTRRVFAVPFSLPRPSICQGAHNCTTGFRQYVQTIFQLLFASVTQSCWDVVLSRRFCKSFSICLFVQVILLCKVCKRELKLHSIKVPHFLKKKKNFHKYPFQA